ncbi:MAG: type II secretion system F family protein [Candidatus Diapherotrites archaeon]
MIYRRISAFLPKPFLEWLAREIEFSGVSIEEKSFAGFLVLFSLAISSSTALIAYSLMNLSFALVIFVAALVLSMGGLLFWLNQVAESKGKFVEKILPDVLQLIASNIKAGLTTERSLFVSARPEFGPLTVELKTASKNIIAGERIERALLGIPKKIKSKVLERTLWLLSEGIKNGGQIADLLLELGNDLREENTVKAEIKSNISMYIILIFIAAAFGAPMLFGVSSFIVGILEEQMGTVDLDAESLKSMQRGSPLGNMMGVPTASVGEDFVVGFVGVCIVITAIFAGLTIGVINSGKEKDGIKYIPLVLLISFVLFYLVRAVLEVAFGSLFLYL